MHRLIPLVAISVLAFSTAATARTAEGNVKIENAEDLKAIAGVSIIEGDLTIINYPEASLKGLDSVVLIKGNLIVFGNPELESVEGLSKLEMVDGGVSIFSNPKLATLTGLTKLKKAQDGFTVTDNPVLTKLPDHGITIGEPIYKVNGFLTIEKNRALDQAHVDAFVESCKVQPETKINKKDNADD